MTPPDRPTVEQEMTAILEELAADRQLAEDGRAVDLVPLEARAADACRRVVELSPEQARDLTPVMERLLQALDDLEAALHRQHAATAEAPGGVARW